MELFDRPLFAHYYSKTELRTLFLKVNHKLNFGYFKLF